MKNLILIIGAIGLFTCSSCSNKVSSDDMTKSDDSTEIIWIEVADSMSNFEALLLTNELCYLGHMSADYDNYDADFWSSVDTIANNDRVLTRVRKGRCQNPSDTSQIQLCTEQQEHTINKNIGKVVKFTGSGSGYFARIEFTYNAAGKLIQYKDLDKVFCLRYDDKNNLVEVLKTETTQGIKNATGLIKFKKLHQIADQTTNQ